MSMIASNYWVVENSLDSPAVARQDLRRDFRFADSFFWARVWSATIPALRFLHFLQDPRRRLPRREQNRLIANQRRLTKSGQNDTAIRFSFA
jgi:hypothetical protein